MQQSCTSTPNPPTADRFRSLAVSPGPVASHVVSDAAADPAGRPRRPQAVTADQASASTRPTFHSVSLSGAFVYYQSGRVYVANRASHLWADSSINRCEDRAADTQKSLEPTTDDGVRRERRAAPSAPHFIHKAEAYRSPNIRPLKGAAAANFTRAAPVVAGPSTQPARPDAALDDERTERHDLKDAPPPSPPPPASRQDHHRTPSTLAVVQVS